MARIAIGVPSGETVMAKFAVCLASLMRRASEHEILLINSMSCYITQNRNKIVRAALEHKCDYVFFLDTDMLFPADTLERLLARDKDIVAAVYRKRLPPFEIVAVVEDGQEGQALQKARLLPTGCMLIKTEVFKKMKTAPLWFYEEKTDNETIRGEDYVFSIDAGEAGFELWADSELSNEIAHIASCEVHMSGVHMVPDKPLRGVGEKEDF